MTPADFNRRMMQLCNDVAESDALKKAGAHLMCEALGENAEAYLLGLERLTTRVGELRAQEKRDARSAYRRAANHPEAL